MKRLIPLLLSLATALALTPASNAQYYPPAGNPNAVAPSGTPATGDTVYYNGSTWVRLAHAADGTVMVLASGIPSWTALSAGIPVPSSPATGSILWYNGTAWIASLNGLFGSGVTDNGTLQLGNNTNSVSGVLVVQSGGATGQGVLTYPGSGNVNLILPTANRTGLTANPGSTLPLLISSTGVESTGALSYAQGGTGATSFTNHTLVTAGASALGGITPGAAGHVPRSNATDYIDAQLGLSDLSGTVSAGQFPALTGDITTAGGSLATTLKNTGPGAGSFTNSNITIDNQGRVTAAANGSAGSSSLANGGILTSNTALAANTVYRLNSAGGVFTITLPDAVGNAGCEIDAELTAGGNAVSIASTSLQTINTLAASTFQLSSLGTGWRFRSDGANWNVVPMPKAATGPYLVMVDSKVNFVPPQNLAYTDTAGQITLGNAGLNAGKLLLASANGGTATVQSAASASSATLTLPTVTTIEPTAQPGANNGVRISSTAGVQSYTSDAQFNGTSGSTLLLGLASSATGILSLAGTTSGNANLSCPATAGTPTFNLNSPGSGTTQDLVPVGGNASDGATTLGASTVEGQQFNYTTLALTNAQVSVCAGCTINTSGVATITAGGTLRGGTAGTAGQTAVGVAGAGGTGAAGASAASGPGYGVAPGGGAAAGAATEGPGGGAGAAASGGSGGGSVQAGAPESGLGGINGGGASAHYGGCPNGSGGGGGASGASGVGGNGGGGANHITVIAAGGFAGTGTVDAKGAAGAVGTTLGSGGGGGGGGSVWLYGGSGNLTAFTVSVVGGAGGNSAGVAVNSGGGGGGYCGGSNNGTVAGATFTVTGGAAGTGGSGAAGSSGSSGLANMRASIAPTLPQITFDQMDGGAAGKNMCWILLARKAIRGEDYESEKSHIFIWDGEKNQHIAPLSYVAATYAKPGAFGELYTALRFGGDDSTANLCDANKVDDCRKMFDQFKDSPIKGEMPMVDSTCDDTEFLRPSV